MTAAAQNLPAAVDPKRATLANDHERALSALVPSQRAYVEALLESGDVKAALAEAGITAKDGPRRMRTNPRVQAAIATGRALREYGPAIERHDLESMLEGMLRTRLEDLLVLSDKGIPLDARDWNVLPLSSQKAVKKLRATVERTKLGAHAKLVRIELETYSPLEIMSLLAKLRGWAQPDGPTVNIDLQAEWARIHAPAAGADPNAAPTETVEQIADAILDDAQLSTFFKLEAGERLAYLGRAAAELRRVREERKHG